MRLELEGETKGVELFSHEPLGGKPWDRLAAVRHANGNRFIHGGVGRVITAKDLCGAVSV
jgi:hypothetical protein